MREIFPLSHERSYMVTDELVTGHLKKVEVLSTPSLVLLVERTAAESVARFLDENEGTVGTGMNIKHLAAALKGDTVTVSTTLSAFNGRHLVFDFSAFKNGLCLASGTHERFIVDTDRFVADILKRKE